MNIAATEVQLRPTQVEYLEVSVTAEKTRVIVDQMISLGFVKKQNQQKELLQCEHCKSLLVSCTQFRKQIKRRYNHHCQCFNSAEESPGLRQENGNGIHSHPHLLYNFCTSHPFL